MSQENVEVVRRAFDFFERGELPLEVADPEIRIDNIPESPLPGPYFGHKGLRKWWSDIVDVIPDFRLQLEGGNRRRGRSRRRRGPNLRYRLD